MNELHLSGASGLWGVLAIGFFADNPRPLETTNGRKGLLKGKFYVWMCQVVRNKTRELC